MTSPAGLRPASKRLALALPLTLWSLASVAGFAWLGAYETTPGRVGALARAWPAETSLTLSADRPTVVVFVHPRCPCTRATADGLERLVTALPERFAGVAVVYRPEGSAPSWAASPLRTRLSKLTGFACVDDVGGREARRFGAETSGHVVAFDARGQRLYVGGLTSARGRSGASAQEAALTRALSNGVADPTTYPVYGCPLEVTACATESACPRQP